MKEKKKMGLLSCILMGIGAIIGVGIFGSLPTAVGLAGKGTVLWVMVGACVVVLFKSFPILATSAALPASGANYLHCTKLVNPWIGYMQFVNGLFNVLTIVLLAVVFTPYFTTLFPMVNGLACKIGFILVMGTLGLFGVRTNSAVQNIMVILLLTALGLYIFMGLPAIDSANLTFGEILSPSMTLSGFVAAIAVMQSATYGAHNMVNFADDIENPGRNLPLAIILSPVLVSVIYILMAAVTVGVVPDIADMTLADIASQYMPGALVTAFVVVGPIFGILTSTIPVMMAMTNILAMCAKDRILPASFAKKNKYGVYYVSHLFYCIIALIIVMCGISIGAAFTAFSFFSLACGIVLFIPPLVMHKKYPKCAAHASFKMSPFLMWVVSIIGIIISLYLCYESAREMGAIMWGIFAAIVVLSYTYFLFRIKYLKDKENYDILTEMAKPLPAWEDREKSYQ